MEDLATGRMSVAQIAQRILHRVPDSEDASQIHDVALVKRLLQEETEDILNQLRADISDENGQPAYTQAEIRYRKATKIAMRWIQNYTELNFRSLGSYSRDDLEAIAAVADAF